MKNFKIFCILIVVTTVTFGCAGFGSMDSKENWYGVMSTREFVEYRKQNLNIESMKLAIKKLKSQEVITKKVNGTTVGYEGVIFNNSKESLCFKIFGNERKTWVLEPNAKTKDFLVSGSYNYKIENNQGIIGSGHFKVGIQVHLLFGEKVHWFFGWLNQK